ncbi:MAG: DNA polymerase/3'-5' exonuclease PolX [Flavobacterium sp.]|nr:DNA polymerase/3'-5' exonuclease PolX [Pedobacter sp.]
MENKPIAKTLRLLSQLMELHGENPFKFKSIANSALKVDKLPFPISKKSLTEIEQIDGIGKSTASKIWELINNNPIKELQSLLSQTPEGIVEILQIKGIGPKKVAVIWKDLCIMNIGELYYACNENRLIEAKGFGLKTQDEFIRIIEFTMASSGRYLYARVENYAEGLLKNLINLFKTSYLHFTGDYRRKCEIIDGLNILCGLNLTPNIINDLQTAGLNLISQGQNHVTAKNDEGIVVHFDFCTEDEFGWQLIEKTGNREHVQNLKNRIANVQLNGKTENDIYTLAGLQFIEPELRENTNEIDLAASNALPALLNFQDLKGSLHNHSNWSDGINSIEEMALFCQHNLKLQYFGICDHSKSAFYASGLNEIRVEAQHREIDDLNKKLSPFRIFKGIESDILYDGSLDYSDDILDTFDFVVASVHSIFKMTEQKATDRLIKAIENPFTTILGHPTGRMLLTRSGYPIDHKKVIDACASSNVIIEINANPLRLDLDWRWHRYAIEKGVLLSVNPDAHRITGLMDMRYGVFVARKGGVSADNCLNAMNLKDITKYLTNKKQSIRT